MTDDLVHGRLVALTRITFGAELTAAAAIGDTVLHVDDVADFDELGGMFLFGGDVYEYDDVDDDASTITTTTPVTVAGAIGDPVDRWDPDGGGDGTGALDVDYEADVIIDGMATGSLQVGIDHALIGYLEESIRSGAQESVSMAAEGDDLIIVRVHGKEAVVLLADAAVAAASDAFDLAESAMTAAEFAQATADGKINTFYQTTFPTTGMGVGDLFFDTDDNKAYRYNGTTWVSVQDQAIIAALSAAQSAQTTADGKITHYIMSSAPSPTTYDLGYGDIWTDTANDNRRLYWDGDSWEPIPLGTDGIAAEIIGKILTGGTIRTAQSGNRMEMTQDGAGGIVYFYPGNTSGYAENTTTVGRLNPSLTGTGSNTRFMVELNSGSARGAAWSYGAGLQLYGDSASGSITANAAFNCRLTVAGQMSSNSVNSSGTGWFGDTLTVAAGGLDITGNSVFHNAVNFGSNTVTLSSADVSGFTSSGSITCVGLDMSGALTGATSITTGGSVHGGDVYVDGHPSTANAANAYMNPSTGRLLYSTSTERHKENIRPADIDVEQALALQESFYESNLEEDDPAQVFVGFIAEQAADLGLDHWVSRDDDGQPIAFNYATWPVAQQAILRALWAMVTDLTSRLATLEAA